ncbi:MAG TPA: Na+/H+ antiporter NhaA, partial [Candidatus Caenarcaniphilales bacterium]|nr:Na+/H+ antiporter NhaA [Candidatus Caenarcaniphilales bacterium]
MSEVPTEPIDRVLAPLRAFTHSSAFGGLLLMAAVVIALVWANSPWAASYEDLWHTPVGFSFAGFAFTEELHFWINDGLMAIFFLLVGLEIKREVLVGELASLRRAALPAAAAMGGALVPALIYLVIVGPGSPAARGWGVPMATDIVFALGVLALLGRRAPIGLRVFLTALAIVDDLFAVLVIALFYTEGLAVGALGASAAILVALVAANALGVRRPIVYGLLGVGLWAAVHESGVHATVAGVLLAATIPARTRIDAPAFVANARGLLGDYEGRVNDEADIGERHAALWELEELTEHAQAPMLRMEHVLHPWVAFLIVPVFALANAGVAIGADLAATLTNPVVPGVLLGLVIGKQVGITAGAYLVVRTGRASLPDGVGWRHIYGVGWLGGIGFTMALFVAELAFDD